MVTNARYVPDRGDLIWISLDPQLGHEQAGRRPALVLSPSRYNASVGLAVVCPITNQAKGYPFEVPLPDESVVTGVVLSDQVKSLDWRKRQANYAAECPPEILVAVIEKLEMLLGT